MMKAYFSASSELHSTQIKALLTICIGMVKKVGDDDAEGALHIRLPLVCVPIMACQDSGMGRLRPQGLPLVCAVPGPSCALRWTGRSGKSRVTEKCVHLTYVPGALIGR